MIYYCLLIPPSTHLPLIICDSQANLWINCCHGLQGQQSSWIKTDRIRSNLGWSSIGYWTCLPTAEYAKNAIHGTLYVSFYVRLKHIVYILHQVTCKILQKAVHVVFHACDTLPGIFLSNFCIQNQFLICENLDKVFGTLNELCVRLNLSG